MHDGNTRGFLLAETDLSRMLEASSDSRDEYHYLIATDYQLKNEEIIEDNSDETVE